MHSADNSLTVVRRIEIEHFRCFERVEVDLDPRLTLVVAPNGVGKSSFLDALAIALSGFVRGFNTVPEADVRKIAPEDVRRRFPNGFDADPVEVTPAAVTAFGDVAGVDLSSGWRASRTKTAPGTHMSWEGSRDVGGVARHLERSIAAGDAVQLPLIVAYPTSRTGEAHRARGGEATRKEPRLTAYRHALTFLSSRQHFMRWFADEEQARLDHERSSKPVPPAAADRIGNLNGIRRALDRVLAPAGVSNVRYDADWRDLVATQRGHGTFPISWLSDGVRTMIELVGDIAHRAARLNPTLGSRCCTHATGVALIDEVDLHLHPLWQREIVPALLDAFPRMQFVCTTHSADVISTVDNHRLRLVQADTAANASVVAGFGLQTRGASVVQIRKRVQMAPERPPTTEAIVAEVRTLLDAPDFDPDEVRALLSQLGEQRDMDPEVGALETTLDVREWQQTQR